jgi:hypothetical protein
MGTTSIFGFPYPEDSTPNDLHQFFMDLANAIESEMVRQGTLAARPAAGKRGRFYWATDTKTLSRDDGTTWQVIYGLTEKLETTGSATAGTNASGASGTAIQIGDFGNTTHAIVKVISSAANSALVLQSKGTATGTASSIQFVDGTGSAAAYFTSPSGINNLDTTLVLGRQLGSTFELKRVTQAAPDSGGLGKRALVVDN